MNSQSFDVSLFLRFSTSHEGEVLSCNEKAMGVAACNKIQAINGTRNANASFSTGFVLKAGVFF
ncbi:MAG: hypothetical protein QNL04_09365 [SAR324 cluster bacterium]|nr:hypothetical protein [SAR324 cluster bacterium]